MGMESDDKKDKRIWEREKTPVHDDEYGRISRAKAKKMWEIGLPIKVAASFESIIKPSLFHSIDTVRQTIFNRSFDEMVQSYENNPEFCHPEIGTSVKFYGLGRDIRRMYLFYRDSSRIIEKSREEGKDSAAAIAKIVVGNQVPGTRNEYDALYFDKDGNQVKVWATDDFVKKCQAAHEAEMERLKKAGKIRYGKRFVPPLERVTIDDDGSMLVAFPYEAWGSRKGGFIAVDDSVQVNDSYKQGTMVLLKDEVTHKLDRKFCRLEIVNVLRDHVKDVQGDNSEYLVRNLLSSIDCVAKKVSCENENGKLVYTSDGKKYTYDTSRFEKESDGMDYVSRERLEKVLAAGRKEFSQYGARPAKAFLERSAEDYNIRKWLLQNLDSVIQVKDMRNLSVDVEKPSKKEMANTQNR